MALGRFKIVINVVFVVLILVIIGNIAKAEYTAHGTGTLEITSNNPTATLTVSALNRQAAYVGTNNATIRLTPGTYLVGANDQGSTIHVQVQIKSQHKAKVALDINSILHASASYNTVLEKLPFTGPAFTYTISYYLAYHNGQASPVFIVSSSNPEEFYSAKQWFMYNGIDPSTLQIQYKVAAPSQSLNNTYVGGT